MSSPDDSTSDEPECVDGTYKCVGPSGTSPKFLQCDHGKWILKTCPPGTVAYDNPANGAIYCDFPRSEATEE
jgi:carbohydrate binding protein with CBM19 domain